jgi:hypothetical protein
MGRAKKVGNLDNLFDSVEAADRLVDAVEKDNAKRSHETRERVEQEAANYRRVRSRADPQD